MTDDKKKYGTQKRHKYKSGQRLDGADGVPQKMSPSQKAKMKLKRLRRRLSRS